MRFQSSFASAAVVATKRARAEITPSVGTQPTQPDGTFTPSGTPREDTALVHLKSVRFRQEVDMAEGDNNPSMITIFIDLEFQRTSVETQNSSFITSKILNTRRAFTAKMKKLLLSDEKMRNNVFLWEDMLKQEEYSNLPPERVTATNGQIFETRFMIQAFVTKNTASMVTTETDTSGTTYWQFPDGSPSPSEFLQKMFRDDRRNNDDVKIHEYLYAPSYVEEGASFKVNFTPISGPQGSMLDSGAVVPSTTFDRAKVALPKLSFSKRSGKNVGQLLVGVEVESNPDNKKVFSLFHEALAYKFYLHFKYWQSLAPMGGGAVWKQIIGNRSYKGFVMLQFPSDDSSPAASSPAVTSLEDPNWGMPRSGQSEDTSLMAFLKNVWRRRGQPEDRMRLDVIMKVQRPNNSKQDVSFDFVLDVDNATLNTATNVWEMGTYFENTLVNETVSAVKNLATKLLGGGDKQTSPS